MAARARAETSPPLGLKAVAHLLHQALAVAIRQVRLQVERTHAAAVGQFAHGAAHLFQGAVIETGLNGNFDHRAGPIGKEAGLPTGRRIGSKSGPFEPENLTSMA